MSDRLNELLRQRALLQQHMAWLDREIETAAGTPIAVQPVSAVGPPAPLPPIPVIPLAPELPAITIPKIVAGVAGVAAAVPRPEALPAADAILAKYRAEPRSLQQDVRKGCFLYFAAAFLLLGLGVVGLYFALRKD